MSQPIKTDRIGLYVKSMPIDPVLTVLTVLTVMRHWKTERNCATSGNVSVIALWMITPIEDETGTTSDAVAVESGEKARLNGRWERVPESEMWEGPGNVTPELGLEIGRSE
jgi:hypothetical protein